MDLVEYRIYDVNGNVYSTHVTRDEVQRLDMDAHHRFRLLNTLTKLGQQPLEKWSDSSAGPAPTTGAIRKQVACKGKGTGGKWPGKTADIFLAHCKQYRQVLRLPQIPFKTWVTLSEDMNKIDLDYSPEQLREKIKHLKRTYADCKKGLHGGQEWHHFQLMQYLYDDAILMDSPTELAVGLGSVDLSAGVLSDPVSEDPTRNASAPLPESDGSVCVGITLESEEDSNNHHGAHSSGSAGDYGFSCYGAELGSSSVADTSTLSGTPPGKSDAECFRSPPKKVGTQGPVLLSESKRPTPKRKVAAAALVWPQNHTKEFVRLCLLHKKDIQKKNIPIGVWHDIQKTLTEEGILIGQWPVLRAKYTQMHNYFENTLLKVGGLVGGVMWPYYEMFCNIYDVSVDYTPPLEDVNDAAEAHPWKETAEELLIAEYAARKDLFQGTNSVIRIDEIYAGIAQVLRSYGVNVTTKQTRSHMENLIMEFKKEYDRVRNSTGGSPSTLCHYNSLLDIFHGTATLEPPRSVSVGRGLLYCVQGVKQPTEACVQEGKQLTEAPQKTYRFKSAASVPPPQRRQMEQRDDMLTELRLLREAGNARSAERTAIMKETLECLKNFLSQKKS